MGVKGLWRLLLPIGRRISVETLHGQVLAIDASIWLTQFVKAMRDPATGKVCVAAHLIGFFRRLCRLRFHGIKPVFVFDGATPEIKKREVADRRRRREQFAVLTDGSVQRLARKLLQETLQKTQKEAAAKLLSPAKSTAFVAGFNPGSQAQPSTRPSNGHDAKPSGTANDGNEDDDVLVFEGDNESTALPQGDQKHSNDWDLPLAVAAAEEAKEMESDANSGEESATEYEEFNPTSKSSLYQRQKRRRKGGGGSAYQYDGSTGSTFSVDLVASLPAGQRKDAVEQAQRDQRLQSRKEFMPAAAHPATFSSVQLKNFLKSCQLNKDIHSMAQTAALRDSDGLPGEAMASDRTTRVELIREGHTDSTAAVTTRITNTSNKGAAKMAAGVHGGNKTLGQDSTSVAKSVHWSSNKRGRSDSSDEEDWGESSTHLNGVVIDDDDEEETMSDNVRPIAAKRPNGGQTIDLADDSEDDANVPHPTRSIHFQQSTIDINASDDETDDGGGGFLPSKDADMNRSFSERAQPDQAQDTSSDKQTDLEYARQLQEREDRRFARSLQQEDDDESAIAGDTPPNGEVLENAIALESQKLARKPQSGAPSYEMEQEDNSADEDDVDWEDGATSDDAAMHSHVDERIDEPNRALLDHSHQSNSLSWAGDTNSIDEGEEQEGLDNDFAPFKTSRSGSGQTRADDSPEKALSPETSAALLQAQTTAANLTNWAGRAFLRAIKEAGGETDPALDVTETTDAIVDPPQATYDSASSNLGSLHKEPELAVARDTVRDEPRGQNKESESLRQEPFDPSFLEQNEAQWTAERNRRERDMDTVSDEMLEEAKQLLQLFGVPYVDAPTEAEAQCAALENLGLVDGIVTEDSDVFVFGGKKVYKNIFDEQKYAEVYAAADAEKEMRLGRNQMVALAMLLGSDYTEGIKGVGIVNAMEILEAFDVSDDLKDGLESFRKWLDGFDPADVLGVKAVEHRSNVFHKKHWTARTRWVAPKNFPADNVMKAYLDPVVDKSTERFSWGAPDVEKLILFCNKYIGWPPEDTKALLDPVMKELQGGLRQTRIDSYMKYEDSIKFAHIRSKRLRDVLGSKTDSEKKTEEP